MPLKPLRSLLFLPATAEHLLAKATDRGADALVIDLEDAIPPERKAAARPMAHAAVQQLADRGATVVLRVNSDPELWQEDLRGMPLQALSAIMLPKVEFLDQVDALAAALMHLCGEQPPPLRPSLKRRVVFWLPPRLPATALCALWVLVQKTMRAHWAFLPILRH